MLLPTGSRKCRVILQQFSSTWHKFSNRSRHPVGGVFRVTHENICICLLLENLCSQLPDAVKVFPQSTKCILAGLSGLYFTHWELLIHSLDLPSLHHGEFINKLNAVKVNVVVLKMIRHRRCVPDVNRHGLSDRT